MDSSYWKGAGNHSRQLQALVEANQALDLHSHSRCSDGAWTPVELVEHAARAGIRLLSLTDHNTLRGVEQAYFAGCAHGVLVLSGVEVSLTLEGRLYHLLCYDADPHAPCWPIFERERQVCRNRYYLDLFSQLAVLGYEVEPELARDDNGMFLHWPLEVALCKAGLQPSLDVAYQLVHSLPLVDRMELNYMDLAVFAELVRETSMLCAIAHPYRQQSGVSHRLTEHDLRVFQTQLPLVALEVYHPDHSAEEVATLRSLAASQGLAATAGSDAHGPHRDRLLVPYQAQICQDFLRLLQVRWAERERTVN